MEFNRRTLPVRMLTAAAGTHFTKALRCASSSFAISLFLYAFLEPQKNNTSTLM